MRDLVEGREEVGFVLAGGVEPGAAAQAALGQLERGERHVLHRLAAERRVKAKARHVAA